MLEGIRGKRLSKEKRRISIRKGGKKGCVEKERGRSKSGWGECEARVLLLRRAQGWKRMSVSEEFPRTYKQITQPDAPSRTLSPLVTVSYVCATPISSLGSTASPTHIRTPALPKGYPSSLAYFFHSHLPYSRTFSLFLLGIKISSFLRPYRATILINSAGKSSLKRRSLALLPFLFELDNLSLLRRAAPFIFLNPASPSSSRRGAKVLSHFHPTSSPLSLSLVQESTSRIVIVIRAINPCFKRSTPFFRKGKKDWTLFWIAWMPFASSSIKGREGTTNHNAPYPTTCLRNNDSLVSS